MAEGGGERVPVAFVNNIVQKLIVEAFIEVPTTRKRNESFGEEAVFDMVGVEEEGGEMSEYNSRPPSCVEEDQTEHSGLVSSSTTPPSTFVATEAGSYFWLWYILVALSLLFLALVVPLWVVASLLGAAVVLGAAALLWSHWRGDGQRDGYLDIQ